MDRINNIFKSEIEFKKNLVRIIKKYYEEKLTEFLEYCIHTNNTDPIMETLYIMSVNNYNKKRI